MEGTEFLLNVYLFHTSVPSFLKGRGSVRLTSHMEPHQHSHIVVYSSVQTCLPHTLKCKTTNVIINPFIFLSQHPLGVWSSF